MSNEWVKLVPPAYIYTVAALLGSVVLVETGVIMRRVYSAVQEDRANVAKAAKAAAKLDVVEKELAETKQELVLQRTNHLTHIQDATARMVELQLEANGYLKGIADSHKHRS